MMVTEKHEKSSPSSSSNNDIPRCRIAIVGAQRPRVAKVISLLRADESLLGIKALPVVLESVDGEHEEGADASSAADASAFSRKKLPAFLNSPKSAPLEVDIEYLPCVATFDSYEDGDGADVRYLVKVEYHGSAGTDKRGTSLAPFLNDASESSGEKSGGAKSEGSSGRNIDLFCGIAAVAVGCGIEAPGDVDKIETFVKTLFASCEETATSVLEEKHGADVLVDSIHPNPGYASMKEENEAFRALNKEAKKEAVIQQTIGPGKMAKFVSDFAMRVISRRFEKDVAAQELTLLEDVASRRSTAEQTETVKQQLAENETEEPSSSMDLPELDPESVRYSCKRCRTILFGEQDFEDPPHATSRHDFRKKPGNKGSWRGGTSSENDPPPCANAFLSHGLPWMGDLADMEGKFHCPKCRTKVGHYSWTGAQCSCGTWVTPAILVPLSKVDVIRPISENPLLGLSAMFSEPKYLESSTVVSDKLEMLLISDS